MDRAAQLISELDADPAVTAQRWASGGSHGTDVHWPDFLVLALQHRVPGLALDALREIGWFGRVSLSITDDLARRATSARLRQQELETAIGELYDREPEVVSRCVLFKGANLYGYYRKPEHRLMSDFDLLMSDDDHAALAPRFAELGYWIKDSLNGPTYFRRKPGAVAQLCIDAHICGPAKYSRPAEALSAEWLTDSLPAPANGLPCRYMSPDLQALNLLAHSHEHAASWIHAVLDDDIRLIRALDLEVLCAGSTVSADDVWQRARRFGLAAEVALGVWLQAQIRGALPAGLTPLTPLADTVAEFGETFAAPAGAVARWSTKVADRIFRTDRIELAFADLGLHGSAADWLKYFDMEKQVLIGPREEVEKIAAAARDRVPDDPAHVDRGRSAAMASEHTAS
ncbi:MAG TPA: nucleotidyltransferase family protein [Pseudonocardiaceae bacterium]|jgi:hypothetical protein